MQIHSSSIPCRCVRILSLLVLIPAMSGCFSYHRAKGEALVPEPIAPSAWPTFETQSLTPLLETPKVITRYQLDPEYLRNLYPTITDEQIIETQTSAGEDLIRNEIVNNGLFRLTIPRYKSSITNKSRGLFKFTTPVELFQRNGSYLAWSVAHLAQEERRIKGDQSAFKNMSQLLSKTRGFVRTGVEEVWLLDEGLQVGLPYQVSDAPTGLILHISSLIENKYEHDMLRRMSAYGWAIAHLDSNIDLDGPSAIDARVRQEERRERARELYEAHPGNIREQLKEEIRAYTDSELDRMAEIMKMLGKQARDEFPEIDSGFEIHPNDDLQAKAQVIANAVDTRLAEHAYAAQSLISAIDEMHPVLADRPILVMGFSAGAIASPTVAARLHEIYPDRPILMVMVGGGGNVLKITQQSDLENGGINLKPKEGLPPTQSQLDELQRAYEQRTQLDPIKVASSIRDIPVLHIYGKKDTVVPTSAAHEFNSAHGHVDRIVYTGNHYTLFYFMSGQAGKIRSWLKTQGIE